MEAPPRGRGAVLECVRPGTSGLVCIWSDLTLSPLVLPHTSSSSRTGCYGTDVAKAVPVRFSHDCSAPGSSGESAPGRGWSAASSPILAGPSMVLGAGGPSQQLSVGDSCQEGPTLSGGELHLSPLPKFMETVGVAPEGAQLIASGLSTEVVETILQSKAPSTRKLYSLKWVVFTSWCGNRQLVPVNCLVGSVL